MPDLKEIDLKKISIEKSNLQIRDEDIKNTLDDLAKRHGKIYSIENPKNC